MLPDCQAVVFPSATVGNNKYQSFVPFNICIFQRFYNEAAVSTNQRLKSLDLGEGQPRSMSEDLE